MNIQFKGFVLIAVLLGAAWIVPALNPVFAAGNTTSNNANSTTKLQLTSNANASKTNSTTYPPPSTVPPSTGTPSSGASPITVTTDKSSYNGGDKIMISGQSSAYLSDTPVSVIVRNPVGNVIFIAQIPLGTDRSYSTTITAGGGLWQAAGTYSVYVQLGSPDRSAKTSFNFTGAQIPSPPSTIQVDGTSFSISYTITNGKVLDIKADVPSKSLIVSIQTTGNGTLTITLPRALIDAKKSDGTDDQFVVSNDGQAAQFNETSTTNTDRTLTIPFKNGTHQIQIMGTFVIPEFGPITALVLAIAIISIIAVTSKAGLRFMPKY